jgi:hypothetical protein
VTRRAALVLLDPGVSPMPPPGVSADSWRAALAEDVADLVGGLAGVEGGVVAAGAEAAWAAGLVWPGAPVFSVADVTALAAFDAAARAGHEEAAVLAPDAPDLPALHIGKLFRALGSHPVAVAPAADGGAVAVAVRLPVPDWVRGARPGLDEAAVQRLRAAAPAPRDVAAAPSWHRLRIPADIRRLDPGLEGWDATRALLSATPAP